MSDSEWRIERERHMRRIKSTADEHELACINADYYTERFTNVDPHSTETYDTFIRAMKRAIEAGHSEAVFQTIKNL